MSEDDFWELAQAAWDERRDPLEDPALRMWLLEHPDHLDELTALRESLAFLASAPCRQRSPRHPLWWLAAAALLAAFALLDHLDLENAEPRSLAPAPIFEVLSLRVVRVCETPSRRAETTVLEGGWSFRGVQAGELAPDASRFALLSSRIDHSVQQTGSSPRNE